jgi:hypothetical protein
MNFESSAAFTPPALSDDSTANTNPTRSPLSFSSNRLSVGSISSIRTVLPQYSAAGTLEGQASTASHVNADSHGSPLYAPSFFNNVPSRSTYPRSAPMPPRYSSVNSPHSLTSAATRLGGDPHEFRYSYPIRSKNPWATLHLHTRDTVPGNLHPLQSQPRVPRLWSCDPIRGKLELNLESPQNIQQITIVVRFDLNFLWMICRLILSS